MCLAIPLQVTALRDDNRATAALGGVEHEVCLDLVEGVQVGDWLIVHVGQALRRLEPAEAAETLRLLGDIAEAGRES
jgi:hydrogenase expression/formation protein HypC